METQTLTQFWSFFLDYIFPPVFYGFHGWFATAMAIWALFHPYEAWYFPFTKWQIPCTPGIFPKRRAKLAQAVAGTITDTLLTTQDIKSQAEQLVTSENIYLAVDGFVDALIKEFRNIDKLHRLASDLSELSPALLQQYVVSMVDALEKGSDKRLASIVGKIFDQIVLPTRIPKDQAEEFANRLMETVVNPPAVRNAMISLLTPSNINALDESIQSHASTAVKLLARFINVKKVCYESRQFLEKQPDESHALINDLLKRFEIRDQISAKIATFDMRSLPMQTIANLRANTLSFVERFLVEHRLDILDAVQKIEGEARETVKAAIIRFNPGAIPSSWLEKVKVEVAQFIHSYLQRELGELLERAIPALGVYGLIARKIELFSPQQLEHLVKRICRQELFWLEILGGFIGFWLGAVQILVNLVSKSGHQ